MLINHKGSEENAIKAHQCNLLNDCKSSVM
jgi:hypothetical protein